MTYGLLWGMLATPASAQDHRGLRELVRQVVRNELVAARDDHTCWRYISEERDPNGHSREFEVVQTPAGRLKQWFGIDGRGLTASERESELGRIEKLVSDGRAQQKLLSDERQDAEHAKRMFELFPEAFDYTAGGEENGRLRLVFTPRASFTPPTREAQVFHAMAGTMWIDAASLRLAKIEGRLVEEVKFGWGLLGHLDRGGTFVVEQREVGPGHWDLTRIHVNMNGRALFFKAINVQQNERHSHFQRVDDAIDLASAAALLRHAPQPVLAANH